MWWDELAGIIMEAVAVLIGATAGLFGLKVKPRGRRSNQSNAETWGELCRGYIEAFSSCLRGGHLSALGIP